MFVVYKDLEGFDQGENVAVGVDGSGRVLYCEDILDTFDASIR